MFAFYCKFIAFHARTLGGSVHSCTKLCKTLSIRCRWHAWTLTLKAPPQTGELAYANSHEWNLANTDHVMLSLGNDLFIIASGKQKISANIFRRCYIIFVSRCRLSLSTFFLVVKFSAGQFDRHRKLPSSLILKGVTVIFKISTFTPNAIYTWTGGKNYAKYFKRVMLDTFWLKPFRRQKL